jgi:small-conductance mechanosensitive channel
MFGIILATFMVSLLIGLRNILPSYGAGISYRENIKIGDRIKVSDHSGTVEKIGPISITIKNGKKRTIIPNSILTNEPVEKF